MHWKSVLVGAAFAAAVLLTSERVFSDDESDYDGRPGPEHSWLAVYEGNWNISGTFTGDGEARPVTGQVQATMILGGRFLKFEGDYEVKGDTPMHTLEILGFDRSTGKFVWLDLDDDDTNILNGEGSYDSATRLLTVRGTEDLGRGDEWRFRNVLSEVVGGTCHHNFFSRHVGTDESKQIRLTYTRSE
jgi:hypothetical protein